MARTPSTLRSMLRLAARAVAARGRPAAPDAVVPRRRPSVERASIDIDPRRIQAYLEATGGERIPAFRGSRPVAPPFFSATWETGMALELLAGLEAPLPPGALVHASTEVTWARTLRAGDAVRARVELERMEPARQGLRMTVLARTWLGAGQLCCESTSVFVLRTRAVAGDGSPPRVRPAAEEARAPERGWVELVRWSLPGGAGRRYARVSGDYNPIHLFPWTARPFGYRRPILHGYAIAARAAHTLIEHRLRGDPGALRRMRIAFRAPLPLPSTAAFWVNDDDGAARWFRVARLEDGRVLAEGTYGASLPTPTPGI